jgi:iron complex outermembrane receptor protein
LPERLRVDACWRRPRRRRPHRRPRRVPAPAPAPGPTPRPAAGTQAPPATGPAGAAGETLAPVEITGTRGDDTDERRRSTAAKIVVGREEIEKFGDSTLGDVLRRLPGVTIGGRPGRGGPIRMRGLGSGYTQILLDGERVPPGFSLDSIPPDQVERIEVLRAPTAETGARAIAGTINIILREGYRRRVNDVRANLSTERGGLQGGASWTRNVVLGDWTANATLTAFGFGRDEDSVTEIVSDRLADGVRVGEQTVRSQSRTNGYGLNANGRLQWRSPVVGGDTVTITPFLFANRYAYDGRGTLEQRLGATPPLYDAVESEGDGGVTIARLNGQWNTRLGSESRLELRAGAGTRAIEAVNLRSESTGAALTRTLDDRREARDRTLTAGAKLVRSLFEDHSLVAGVEFEGERLRDERRTLQDGLPILGEFDEALRASTTRVAGYAQDEWNINPQWAAHVGLRWESIATRGSGVAGQPDPKNRSSVWTPLLHTTWKPDPKSRDQLRVSLTRSYKSPMLGQLVSRPAVNSRFPVSGPNTPTQVDRAGNPELQPELAQGVDIAVERYLPSSGI